MGNICDKFPLPDPNTTNHCDDYFSGEPTLSQPTPGSYTMNDFCTYAGIGGSSYRTEWCDKLGSPGEWGVYDLGQDGPPLCFYNNCNPYQNMGEGYCGWCTGTRGASVICIRKEFHGDPIKCCLQDKVCTSPGPGDPDSHTDAPSSCFSDKEKKDTCAPCHRDVTSNDFTKADGSKFSCTEKGLISCQEYVIEYCSGQDLSIGDSSWIHRWTDPDITTGIPPCIYALKRNIFSDVGCPAINIPLTNSSGFCTPVTVPLSAQGTIWARTLMNSTLERYALDGFVLGTNPGDVGYDTFQDTVYQLGCAVPIIMEDSLNRICSVYTAEGVSRNPTIANFCGCYLNSAEYIKYVNDYQVDKECTPMCNRLTTIPIISGDNQPVRCNQSSCIIDDITINIISSNIGQSGIGISQVCGNCSGNNNNSTGSCNCIISSDVIDAVNANIGGINISEQCSSSICSIPNPNPFGTPPTVSIPCDQITNPSDDFNNEVNKIKEEEARAKQRKTMVIIFTILLFLFIVFIVILASRSR